MKMKLPPILLCILSLQIVETRARPSQAPLAVEEVLAALHLPPETPLDLSPDGKWLAYTLQDDRRKEKPKEGYTHVYFTPTGVNKGILGCDIWVTTTQSGESKNLTEGTGTNWSPVWSPDGNHLAFYSDRSGAARLWVWEKLTGRLWQVSDKTIHPYYTFEVARWSPDSRRILVKILPEGVTIEAARDAIVSPQQMMKSPTNGPTVLVYRSSASLALDKEQFGKETSTSSRRADLALIESATGKLQRIATGFNPAWYDFSPDGSNVAFTTTKGFESPQSQQRVYDLVLVSLGDGHTRVVAPNIQLDYYGVTVSWSPNGKMLSYLTSGTGKSVKGDCFIVPVDGGEPRNATATPHPYFSNGYRSPLWGSTGEHIYLLSSDSIWKVTVSEPKAEAITLIPNKKIIEAVAPREGGRLWSPDSGRSMIVATRDEQTKQQGFYQIDLTTGKLSRLIEEKKSYGAIPIHSIDVSSDGKQVIFVAEDAGHCAEVWLTGVNFKDPKQVTHINPKLDRYEMGSSRVVEWQGSDGETLRGALLLPANYQEGARYPLVVKIYPTQNLSNYVNNFGLSPFGVGIDNMQLLATRGYAVLLPDSPSSKVTPMESVAKTVLPGVSKLVELGIADPERLGVIGHSNGGYGTLSLIVQTTRFKAAVCEAGWGNRIGFYGQMSTDSSSWGVAHQEETTGMGGPPWQFPNRYIENSPLFYLDRVQTPLLLVHGAEDNAVPSFLADEIFVGLRRLGKEVEYAKYEGEGHWQGTWGYANQVDYLNRIIDWFDKDLKEPQGEKPSSEPKPN